MNSHFVMTKTPESLLIFTVHNCEPDSIPIRLRHEIIKNMGPADASKWVGERILLLIPKIREELFKIGPFIRSEELALKKDGNEIERIDAWVAKLKADMDIQAKACHVAFPEMSETEAHERFLLNKIATLTVALEHLAKDVREIPVRF